MSRAEFTDLRQFTVEQLRDGLRRAWSTEAYLEIRAELVRRGAL